jgi:hypothetical protein
MRLLAASRFRRFSIVMLSDRMYSGLGWALRIATGGGFGAVCPARSMITSDAVNMMSPLKQHLE